MITGEATPSLALAAYAETWISGAKVVVFGDARSTLAERLVERGARLVYVYDSDPARVAEATARGRSTQVSYAPLSQAGVAMRDGVFDFGIVEELTGSAQSAEESIERISKMLSPRGVALIAVPNAEAPARLLPTASPSTQGVGYYELYDLVSSRFAEVSMLGQTPFVGYAVADFGASEGDIQLDTGFLPGGAEEPEWFLALASQRPLQTSFFSVVQLPLAEIRSWVRPKSPRGNPDGRVAELKASLQQREEWLASMEARASTADERADRVQGELESVRQSFERQLRELKQDNEALRRDLAERTALANRLDAEKEARKKDDARRSQLNSERVQKDLKEAREALTLARTELEALAHQQETATDKHEAQLARLAEEHEAQLARLAEEHEVQLARLSDGHKSELARLQDEQKAQVTRQHDEHKKQLEERAQELKASKREAQVAGQRADDLERELSILREQAGRADAELAESNLESERLEAQLQERGREIIRLQEDVHRAERLSRQLLIQLESMQEAPKQGPAEQPQETQLAEEVVDTPSAAVAEDQPAASADEPTAPAEPAPSEPPSEELMRLRQRNAQLSADLEAARWTIESLEEQLEAEQEPGEEEPPGNVPQRADSPASASTVGK